MLKYFTFTQIHRSLFLKNKNHCFQILILPMSYRLTKRLNVSAPDDERDSSFPASFFCWKCYRLKFNVRNKFQLATFYRRYKLFIFNRTSLQL